MGSSNGLMWKLILLICICTLSNRIEANIQPSSRGLSGQLLNARQRLEEALYSHSSGVSQLDMKLIWEITFAFPKPDDTENTAKGLINLESMGDQTLAIYRTEVDVLEIWKIKQSKLFMVTKVDLSIVQAQHLKFTKSFEWDDQLFFLVCFQVRCSLFTVALDSTVEFRMSISNSPGLPVEAHFFVQSHTLYLIVLFQTKRAQSITRIYQWDKTSLDDVKTPEMTSSATSITLFNHDDNMVLVMLCSGENNIEYLPQVWLRRASGEILRVQSLPTENAQSISHFVQRGEHFLITRQQNQDKSIYWWTGEEFVRWRLNFRGNVKSTQVFALYNLGDPDSFHHNQTFLVFKTSATTLDVCVMATDSILKVTELALPFAFSISTVTMEVENETIYFLVESEDEYNSTVWIFKVEYSYDSDFPFDEFEELDTNSVPSGLEQVSLSISDLTDQVKELKLILPNLLYTDKEVVLNRTTVSVSGITHIESGKISSLIYINFDVANHKKFIHEAMAYIQDEITYSWEKFEMISDAQPRELEYKGEVYLIKAKMNSLTAVLINDEWFQPDSYLYSTPPGNHSPQRMRKLKVEALEVMWLVTKEIGNSSVNDFIIDGSVIRVPIQVINLTANSLEMVEKAKVNKITVRDLLAKEAVNVFGLEDYPNNKQGGLKKGKTLQLQDDTVINNLYVDEINNIPVAQLLASLFIQDSVHKAMSTVQGNVHFKHGFYAKQFSYREMINQPGNEIWPDTAVPSDYENFQDFSTDQDVYIPSRYQFPTVTNSFGVFRMKREDVQEESNVLRLGKVKVLGDLQVARLVLKNSTLSLNNDIVSLPIQDQTSHINSIPKIKNLVVRDLYVDYINEEDVRTLLSQSKLTNVDVYAEELEVWGNLDSNSINSINFNERFDQTVFVDEHLHLKEAFFESVSANDVKVDNLQEINVKHISTIQNEDGPVNFTGSIHFPNVLNIEMINNETVDFDKIVNKHKPTAVYGKKVFLSQVSIQLNMSVSKINNKAVEDLSDKVLRTSTDQELPGFFSFKKAEINSLSDVNEINGVGTSRFLYTDEKQLNFSKDIKFSSINIEGNVTANRLFESCQLPKIVGDRLQFSDRRTWKSLVVEGDSHWPYTQFGRLQMLLDSAVTNSSDQEITGNIYISQLFTRRLQAQFINGENITFTFLDSLMKSKEKQVISGKKTFKDSLNCQNLQVKGNTVLGRIAGVNQSIADIDTKLIRHTDPENTMNKVVTGHKTFLKGFTAFSLRSSGGINNVKAEHIVKIQTEGDTELPPLIVKSLYVNNNLQVGTINDLRLNQFLSDCIYINSTDSQKLAQQFHINGSLFLEGTVTTPTINNISITNNLIFLENGKVPVWIEGCKVFTKHIHVETNVTVDNLNGKPFYDTYHSSIKKHQNVTLNGNLEILSDVDINTIFAEEFFVGDKKLVEVSNKTASP